MMETQRLRLEPWNHAAHAPGLAAVNAHPDVSEYLGGGTIAPAESDEFSLRIQDHWAAHGFGLRAALRKDTRAMIGFVGLSHPVWFPTMADRVEIGWRLARDAWGAGYATEGARAAVREAFDTLGLEEIIALVHPENVRSLAVCRRLGMVEEAEVPHPSRDHAVRVLALAAPVLA